MHGLLVEDRYATGHTFPDPSVRTDVQTYRGRYDRSLQGRTVYSSARQISMHSCSTSIPDSNDVEARGRRSVKFLTLPRRTASGGH